MVDIHENKQIVVWGGQLPAGGLDAYIQYANSLPMLTKEEEHQLAKDWHDNQNIEAAERLVLSHLRYVVRVAKGYIGYGLNLADLIQEGSIGLMKAVKRFDPEHGVRLVTFAMHWIKAEIHEFVIKNWRVVKIATTKAQRKLFFNLRSKKDGSNWLSNQEVNDIASDLGVKPQEVRVMEQRMYSSDTTFDLPVSESNEKQAIMAPVEYLEDHSLNPAAILEHDGWQEAAHSKLGSALEQLDDRSRYIIEKRWLNPDESKMTLEELSEKFSVSKERVRQIEAKAMTKIKDIFSEA